MSSPRSTKRRAANYATYIPRIAKQVHPENSITGKALNQLRAIAEDLAQRLSSQARQLVIAADRKTVSSREVQNAVLLVLPSELAKHAVIEGVQAVTKFSVNDKGSKAKRANLVIPPSLAEKNLRDHSDLRVGADAPVYLAAVIEYLIAEILELAGNSARYHERVRIKVRDLYFAIQQEGEWQIRDDELKKLVKTELLGSGVIPAINTKLLVSKDKKAKKSKKRSGDKKVGHRFNPGTVALRKIRKYQKTGELLLPKEQFRRLIRTVNIERNKDIQLRFNQQALDDLQYYTEQRLVKLMQQANHIGLAYDRQTLTPKTIRLAVTGMDNFISSSDAGGYSLEKSPISNPSLLRLAQRAGVKRVDKLSYDELKTGMLGIISHILYPSVVILANDRKLTLTPQILRQGAKVQGIDLAI